MTIKLNVKIASSIGLFKRGERPSNLEIKKDKLSSWLRKRKINFSFRSPYYLDVFWDRFVFIFPDEQTKLMFILKWIDDDIQIEKEAETLVLDVVDEVYNEPTTSLYQELNNVQEI